MSYCRSVLRLIQATMTSADFWSAQHSITETLVSVRLTIISLVGNLQTRPPRVRTITFLPYHCRLYQGLFRVVLDFSLCGNLIRVSWPYSRFLFISAAVCSSGFLQIPPRDGHPCPWLVVPTTTAHSGLSPPSYRPCRAHHKNSYRRFNQ